ncbi:MAG: C25 family cysteine peptidase, partial [Thermoplasmatota archaeon]
YAQSANPDNEMGPIISVNVTKDDTQESVITYSHDDHLNPAIQDAFENGFPTVPIAEIVSVSEGDILGNTDIAFDPPRNDYCNEFYFWANVSYVDEVLTIRGKSYDPKPYGNVTDMHVWIKDNTGNIVFEDWRNDTEMYYEGEWTTGEKSLLGRGGALYYMPEEFEKEILWTSNGKLTGRDDVIESVSKGAGFLFFSGHGSPNVWADQMPGIPGDRGHSSVTGMQVTQITLFNVGGALIGQRPFSNLQPLFPMDTLSNGEKLPIAVVGGCHNSQFNVSMLRGFLEGLHYVLPIDWFSDMSMWCHGAAVPETFSWRLIRNPDGGAIASMGNTGLGYGMPGKELTTGGGDSWITIEFFKQYGSEGRDILGDAYMQALRSYVDNFDMTDLSAGHPKTMTQWVLLGDPTLKIGGYE